MNKLKSFAFEGCIFLFLLFSLLLRLPEALHGWNSAWYGMDYSLGFDSRLLIGSILRLLHPDFLTPEGAYLFVFFSILLLLVLLSLLLGSVLKKAKGERTFAGLLFLVFLYLAGPAAPAYLWTAENMGRFDLYLLITAVVMLLLCMRLKKSAARILTVTLLGLVGLCIHPVFFFLFFPLVFLLYVDVLMESEKKYFGRILLSIGGGLVILCAGFLYFQFFSGLGSTTPEQLFSSIAARTSLPVNETAITYEYFKDFQTAFTELVKNEWAERIRYGVVTVFLLLPFFAVLSYLWFYILRASSGKGFATFTYWLLCFSPLSYLFAFVLTIDWGRWFGAYLTVQVLLLLFLAAKKDVHVQAALSRLSGCIQKHPFLFLGAALWIASLGNFQATLLPDAPVFFANLYRLKTLLLPY